ncbi:hypothetical protein SDC9_129396 [bioreactor metagenome]|uniref:Uncharacterized protein n=1 Tax=bioreactor metagenome TaxID=1076179 RepID=A0A645CZN6_9ZZZZ
MGRADDVDLRLGMARVCLQNQIVSRDFVGELDGVPQKAAVIGRGQLLDKGAPVHHQLAVCNDPLHAALLQGGEKHDVRNFARGDAAHPILNAQALGGIERHHLDGGDGVHPLRHGDADLIVQMAEAADVQRVDVVADHRAVSGVHVLLRNDVQAGVQVCGGGAFPHQHMKSHAQLGKGLLPIGALVVAGDPRTHIGVQVFAHDGGRVALRGFAIPLRQVQHMGGNRAPRQNRRGQHLGKAHGLGKGD